MNILQNDSEDFIIREWIITIDNFYKVPPFIKYIFITCSKIDLQKKIDELWIENPKYRLGIRQSIGNLRRNGRCYKRFSK